MTMLERQLRRVMSDFSYNSDTLVLADGTIWSHAATLGTRTKGGEFTIGADEVRNAVTVFTSGYPQKIPVDYNHASTDSDPEIRKLRAQGMVPKAGDVLELRAVLSVADFTGDLKSTAEKLAAKSGRTIDDARNLGLWMRWKPTARALAAIKAEEYTELSITFDEDLPHNVDERGQGFGLWAVALLNTPFLDDMLPVAASRDTDQPPGPRERPASREGSMTKLTALSVAAAMLGRSVASDEEALNELNALVPQFRELTALREGREILAVELGGEKDPTKQVAKIRELRTQLKAAQDAEAEQKKATIKTTVEATITKYEKAISSVPLRKMLTANLTAELEKGVELEKTETLATLKTLGPATNLGQNSAGDLGGAGVDDDVKIDARARELLESDSKLKALNARDSHEAYKEAVIQAGRELRAAKTA